MFSGRISTWAQSPLQAAFPLVGGCEGCEGADGGRLGPKRTRSIDHETLLVLAACRQLETVGRSCKAGILDAGPERPGTCTTTILQQPILGKFVVAGCLSLFIVPFRFSCHLNSTIRSPAIAPRAHRATEKLPPFVFFLACVASNSDDRPFPSDLWRHHRSASRSRPLTSYPFNKKTVSSVPTRPCLLFPQEKQRNPAAVPTSAYSCTLWPMEKASVGISATLYVTPLPSRLLSSTSGTRRTRFVLTHPRVVRSPVPDSSVQTVLTTRQGREAALGQKRPFSAGGSRCG